MHVLLSSFSVDAIFGFHIVDSLVDLVGRDARLDCYVACMQIHVPSLNPFNAQSPERRKVLSKPHGDHHLCKLARAREAHDFVGVDVGRVGGDGAAFGPDRDWDL